MLDELGRCTICYSSAHGPIGAKDATVGARRLLIDLEAIDRQWRRATRRGRCQPIRTGWRCPDGFVRGSMEAHGREPSEWRGRALYVSVARGARAVDRDSEADFRLGGENSIVVAESIHHTGHLSKQNGNGSSGDTGAARGSTTLGGWRRSDGSANAAFGCAEGGPQCRIAAVLEHRRGQFGIRRVIVERSHAGGILRFDPQHARIIDDRSLRDLQLDARDIGGGGQLRSHPARSVLAVHASNPARVGIAVEQLGTRSPIRTPSGQTARHRSRTARVRPAVGPRRQLERRRPRQPRFASRSDRRRGTRRGALGDRSAFVARV